MKFSVIYDQCGDFITEIVAINDRFKEGFDINITENSFEGAFKKSYRKSTSYIYATLNALVKKNPNSM